MWLIFSKLRLFHQKQLEISFYSPVWLNLQEVQTQTTLTETVRLKVGLFLNQIPLKVICNSNIFVDQADEVLNQSGLV